MVTPGTPTLVENPVMLVTWVSDDLLKGTSDVVIVHKGEQYHLKKTKNDRLILTK